MEVCRGGVVGDGEGGAADVEGVIVEGLVAVADEVDEEFEGFEDLFGWKGCGLDARRLRIG